MGGPSTGVSLSQPGVMLSHRHGSHSMLDLDRHMVHPQALLGSGLPDRMRANSAKSTESLDRRADHPTLSIDEELESLDLDEDDRGNGQLSSLKVGVFQNSLGQSAVGQCLFFLSFSSTLPPSLFSCHSD